MQDDTPSGSGSRAAGPAAAKQAVVPAALKPGPQARGITFVHAREGAVDELVVEELAKAKKEGRTLLVYAGATWCEPCQRFHAAATKGELDRDLPGFTFLEFDVDQDRERLLIAGYTSQYIPLFVIPGADGRSTGRQIEGSIKGEGAAMDIVPRLKTLAGT